MDEFRKITECGNYEINQHGVVRHRLTKRIKSIYIGSTGYKMVSLWKDGKSKIRRVHRLMAIEFLENTHNKPHLNHKDGNKLNNDLSNLEWVTISENNEHARLLGLNNNRGEHNGMAKITEGEARLAKEMLRNGISQYKIADEIGVSRSLIQGIKEGRLWAWVK